MTQRALTKGLLSLALTVVLASLVCPRARGDVGIVLNESLGVSVDRISGTGHSAVPQATDRRGTGDSALPQVTFRPGSGQAVASWMPHVRR